MHKSELLASLPPIWPHDLRGEIAAHLRRSKRTIVVLDDDPTGTQTVFGVPILTVWDVETLGEELQKQPPIFYILTNSRALTSEAASQLARDIGRNLSAASAASGREIEILSRGDSTLRGHFPDEVEALTEGLETGFDATLLVPAFFEGGRFTLGDVHYVQEGQEWIEAARTPFARDASFGYQNSNLKQWVEEKTAGRVAAADVASISLQEVREGPESVLKRLLSLPGGAICVVNALHERDLEVLCLAWLQSGRQLMARCAASLVPVRAGIERRDLLSVAELDLPARGGTLIVAGSYVPKTTAQLAQLEANFDLEKIELDVARILDETARPLAVKQAVEAMNAALFAQKDVLLCTSRALITGSDAASSLQIGAQVSAALVEIVSGLNQRPRCVVTKGGITSSDIATKAFGAQRALAVGPIAPGVSVWRLEEKCRFPNGIYVVFPGNVGDEMALANIVETLGLRNSRQKGMEGDKL